MTTCAMQKVHVEKHLLVGPWGRLVPLWREDPFSMRATVIIQDRNLPLPAQLAGYVRSIHGEFQPMRVITVCVGSACHLKSSHEIINYF